MQRPFVPNANTVTRCWFIFQNFLICSQGRAKEILERAWGPTGLADKKDNNPSHVLAGIKPEVSALEQKNSIMAKPFYLREIATIKSFQNKC